MSEQRDEQPSAIEVDVEVRYAETDAMGVVHHSRYLVWFELARTRLCSETGFHYADIEKMGYLLMVTRADLTYRRGARYGDTVAVRARLTRMESRKLVFTYEVLRGSELLVEGTTEHVWLDSASGRPCRVPAELDAPFRALVQP